MSKQLHVYLCGPIVGNPKDWYWREIAAAILKRHGIIALDPLREKEIGSLSDAGVTVNGKPVEASVAFRDEEDIVKSDAILCFTDQQTWGTPMELGMAHAMGKPIFIATTVPRIAKHPFTGAFMRHYADINDALSDLVEFLIGGRDAE